MASRALTLATWIICGLLAGCGGSPEALPDAGSITLSVDGQALTFKKAEPWVFKRFELGQGQYWLETAAHDPEMNTLVLYFSTSNPDLAALAGERFTQPDYSADNPEKGRRTPDWVLNRFEANGKWYQGHQLGGTVRELKDGKLTLDMDSLFLEFGYDEPDVDEQGNVKEMPPPREVRVTGSITLPVKDESKAE